jgi:ABC-type antimicrobial peptide transport system permease subunit
VAATLAAPPFESESVVDRAALLRSLSGDPVSLGIIGALGLGAVAAMVFAGIGFLVSATVSVSERVGEFALLRALGLSGRQLAVWLSLESAFLLFIGLLAGSALGVLLAWLVLPFATLTQTGAPPVPQPTVVVPWQAVVPAWILAVVLLVVTIVIVRRQLPAVRISGVLRARDE